MKTQLQFIIKIKKKNYIYYILLLNNAIKIIILLIINNNKKNYNTFKNIFKILFKIIKLTFDLIFIFSILFHLLILKTTKAIHTSHRHNNTLCIIDKVYITPPASSYFVWKINIFINFFYKYIYKSDSFFLQKNKN